MRVWDARVLLDGSTIEEALAGNPDILVELVGGVELARDAMHHALLQGAQVVTANKAAVARHWDSLHAAASRNGGDLRFSGAVGGGAPVLEALRRLQGQVVSVEGVMNGTCNYLLSRLAEGWSFEQALAKAQELGFAEADPSADVDGHDAADKLSILVRERPRELLQALSAAGVICDFRAPNVIRVAPVPLYNRFHEVWTFAQVLAREV